MTVQDFENLILSELQKVVESIIEKTPSLPIVVKKGERQGDAIAFINFLAQKKKESFQRRLDAAKEGFENIKSGIIYVSDSKKNPETITINDLLEENKKQENAIKML